MNKFYLILFYVVGIIDGLKTVCKNETKTVRNCSNDLYAHFTNDHLTSAIDITSNSIGVNKSANLSVNSINLEYYARSASDAVPLDLKRNCYEEGK